MKLGGDEEAEDTNIDAALNLHETQIQPESHKKKTKKHWLMSH